MAASTARPPMATMANVPTRIGSWYGIDSRLSRPKISLVRLMWSIVTLHGKVGRGRDANLGTLVGGALGVGRQHFIGADGIGADAAVEDGVVQRRIGRRSGGSDRTGSAFPASGSWRGPASCRRLAPRPWPWPPSYRSRRC